MSSLELRIEELTKKLMETQSKMIAAIESGSVSAHKAALDEFTGLTIELTKLRRELTVEK